MYNFKEYIPCSLQSDLEFLGEVIRSGVRTPEVEDQFHSYWKVTNPLPDLSLLYKRQLLMDPHPHMVFMAQEFQCVGALEWIQAGLNSLLSTWPVTPFHAKLCMTTPQMGQVQSWKLWQGLKGAKGNIATIYKPDVHCLDNLRWWPNPVPQIELSSCSVPRFQPHRESLRRRHRVNISCPRSHSIQETGRSDFASRHNC